MLFDARVLKALFRTSVCAKCLSLSQDGQGCCFNHLLVFKLDGLCVYVCVQYLGAVSALIFGLSQSFRDCTLC